MKRLIALLVALTMTVSAFSQEKAPDQPKPKSELYGKFRIDYDLTRAMVEAAQPLYAGFNIDRARFGFNTMMLDNLKALLELEFKPNNSATYGAFELRIAEIDWKIADMFTLSGGRMYEAFAPKSEAYGKFFDGLGGLLDFGLLKVLAQGGNDKDTGINGNHMTSMLGLTVSPKIEGLTLEMGANAKAKFDTTVATPMLWANCYINLKLAGLYVLLDFDANRFDTGSTTYLDFFSDINYKIDVVTPGFKVFWYDLAGNPTASTGHLDLEAYINFEFAKGFIINPRFTISNIMHETSAPLSWKFTLRFEWIPKVAF
jgi:hypothetical protein